MAKTAAQIKATNKYDAKTYDKLWLMFRKDSDINGDVIRAYATAQGESLNGFLLRAVTETIERDKFVN